MPLPLGRSGEKTAWITRPIRYTSQSLSTEPVLIDSSGPFCPDRQALHTGPLLNRVEPEILLMYF